MQAKRGKKDYSLNTKFQSTFNRVNVGRRKLHKMSITKSCGEQLYYESQFDCRCKTNGQTSYLIR